MKFFLTLSLCLFAILSHSSEVIIKGKIKGFENRQLRAYTYEDYITFTKSRIASTPIENGMFQLSFNLEEVEQVVLTIEDKSTVIFAEPGKVYNINLSYQEELNKSNIYDKFLSVDFPFPSTDDLNQLIASFNNDYDLFFHENYKKIFLNLAKKEVKIFVDSIRRIEKYNQSAFIKNYVLYATANLLDISGTPTEKLKNEYLNGKKVNYNNPEYMNFFSQLFDERFRQFAISTEGAEMRKALMLQNNVEQALSIIHKGENLSSEVLAELYLLYGLYEDYNVKTIDQKSNLRTLKHISENGRTNENRMIAKNILNHLQLAKRGSKAPNFTLKDSEGNNISLNDYQGKYIYLNFWSSWSVPSLKELNVMENIYSEYKDQVVFLSISLDENLSQMKEILKNNNYSWPFLHYGDSYELKEKYGVRTVPSYYLIDKKGHFMESPAPSPLKIEEILMELK